MGNLIICPHCGKPIDVTPAEIADLHPNIARTWIILQHSMKRGQRLSVGPIAELVLLNPKTVDYHLSVLVGVGALRA